MSLVALGHADGADSGRRPVMRSGSSSRSSASGAASALSTTTTSGCYRTAAAPTGTLNLLHASEDEVPKSRGGASYRGSRPATVGQGSVARPEGVHVREGRLSNRNLGEWMGVIGTTVALATLTFAVGLEIGSNRSSSGLAQAESQRDTAQTRVKELQDLLDTPPPEELPSPDWMFGIDGCGVAADLDTLTRVDDKNDASVDALFNDVCLMGRIDTALEDNSGSPASSIGLLPNSSTEAAQCSTVVSRDPFVQLRIGDSACITTSEGATVLILLAAIAGPETDPSEFRTILFVYK